MKRLGSIAAGSFVMLAATSAFAQQNPNPATPEPPYGYYHHMWDRLWDWHTGMIIGPVTLVSIIGVGVLIVLLLRGFEYGASHHWYRHAGHPSGDMPYGRGALDILEERFTKGE